MSPDLILTNARVLTMDAGRPRAEAVAIADDTLMAVGARAGVEAPAGPGTRVWDVGGWASHAIM